MINESYNMNCMEYMEGISDNYFDVIMFDGPYFNIKGDFDFIYENRKEWQGLQNKLAKEFRRILKNNGSLFVWGHALNIAYQQIEFDKYFRLLNSGVWEKAQCQTKKIRLEDSRRFIPVSERWLYYDLGEDKSGNDRIFSDPDLFQSIKKYMRNEAVKIREHFGFKTTKEFNEYINRITQTSSIASNHYFADSQWCFPTKEMYLRLQTSGYFNREHETLRIEYETLRRLFNPSDKLKFDVVKWSQETHLTKKSNHPTKKPLGLIREMIKTVTKPGSIVYDPMSGSGTTQRACWDLKINYIGNELNIIHFLESEKLFKLHSQESIEGGNEV